MNKKIKSAKGELVDFQLLKLKQTLTSSPITVEVKNREKFIENKLNRKIIREKNKLLNKLKDNKETIENNQSSDVSFEEKNNILNNEQNKRKIRKKD